MADLSLAAVLAILTLSAASSISSWSRKTSRFGEFFATRSPQYQTLGY